MTKSKSKFKGFLKGAALGFAVILCSAFFPANAVNALAADLEGEKALSDTYRIEVDGNIEANNNSATVTKGDSFTIPVGVYHSATSGEHIIGTAISGNITTSKIEVSYKATGDIVKTISGAENEGAVTGLEFLADRVGTYAITYTVIENGTTYSYDFSVTCEADEATFEFKGNDSNIIPSVYDTQLSSKLDGENKNKDIKIPLPTVLDEDGEEILTSADTQYYILDKNGTGIPSIENSKNCFVYISLTNGDEIVTLQGENGNYYIDGDVLVENGSTLNNQEYKLTYTFYQINENGKSFISSTSKTFKVKNGYYYTDSEKETSGYAISADFATTVPSSAVVGVEVSLPSVSATTSSKNSPSSESVDVYYEITVKKMKNGKYEDDVTETVYNKEDNTFKAVEEGSYQIIYTIKDFYGNETTKSFYLDNVKDSQSAQVYMYDAGTDVKNKDGSYSSTSEYKLSSQRVARNIIVYAIAGTDNMPTNEITLRREIRLGSTVRFNVKEQKYNDYNLIFEPSANDNEGEYALYAQIANDNYEIRKQMVVDGLDFTDGEVVKQWLKDNKYLIVTTDGKDASGAYIAGENADINNETVIDQFINAGYAYIKAETSDGNYTFTAGSYNIYYYASDNINAEKSKNYSVTLSSAVDEGIPTINFDTDLQTTYLTNETIEFTPAGASDTVDSRLEVVTAYRYLGEDKTTPVASEQTNKTIQYLLENWNSNDSQKWYVKDRDAKGLVTSEGWFYDLEAETYKIDLSQKPTDAKYVEILCYAIDDNGNVGFYNRIIKIADTTDNDTPVLYKVVNAPEDIESQDYNAPSTIILPTLYFTDSRVEYMNADVMVYKITKDEEGNVTERKLMQSTNMTTRVDTYRGTFSVDGGIFNASSNGTYQVVITVSDSANHTVSTYFDYVVGGGVIIEDPVIDNITSEPVEIAIDESYRLTTPTISVTASEEYGYIGLNDEDDSNAATYYTTSLVSATSNQYELNQYEFIGKAKGTYKLQYEVYLMRYKTSQVTETPTTGKLFLDENGRVKYYDGSKEYFVFIEENVNYGKSEDEVTEGTNIKDKYIIAVNENITGIGTSSLDSSVVDGMVELFVLTSDIQTITVKDVVITVSIDEDAYAITKYPTIDKDNPTPITIVKPNVIVSGADKGNGIDLEASTVQITRTSGSSTTTLATITLAEWEHHFDDDTNRNFDIQGSTIKLLLLDNGKYTIKYSIQAVDYLGQKVGDIKTLEYTISNGDVEAPSIELADEFVKSTYNLGDTLVLNMSGIEITDNNTSEEELLKTLVITLKNTDTEESWTLENDPNASEGTYIYEHKFESAGNYTLTISVEDGAGITGSQSVSFTVSTKTTDPVNVTEVLGGVLIGLSVALLAGVVIYFIVSKVKLDKKEKSYKAKIAKKDDKNENQ